MVSHNISAGLFIRTTSLPAMCFTLQQAAQATAERGFRKRQRSEPSASCDTRPQGTPPWMEAETLLTNFSTTQDMYTQDRAAQMLFRWTAKPRTRQESTWIWPHVFCLAPSPLSYFGRLSWQQSTYHCLAHRQRASKHKQSCRRERQLLEAQLCCQANTCNSFVEENSSNFVLQAQQQRS